MTETQTGPREDLAAFTTRELRDELARRYAIEPKSERYLAGQARFNERVNQIARDRAQRRAPQRQPEAGEAG